MLSEDDKRLLADWARHPGADIARKWLIEKQRAEEAKLGRDLYVDPASFDPVKVAETAGRHKGRLEVLNKAWLAAKTLERNESTERTDT